MIAEKKIAAWKQTKEYERLNPIMKVKIEESMREQKSTQFYQKLVELNYKIFLFKYAHGERKPFY